MSGSLGQIIEVNITQETQAVQQPSFSIPLIIGPTMPSSGIVNTFSSPAGMLTAGYTVDSPEYIYALELFEQALSPTEFLVGQRQAAVEQIDTFTVNTVVSSHSYAFTLNGNVISYTSISTDSYSQILNGLLTDIGTVYPTNPPVTGAITGSGSGTTLTLTSTVAGTAVLYSAIGTDLTHVNTTPNYGIQNDINAIISVSNQWYGMCLTQGTDGDIEQAAALIETLTKIYIAISDTSAIATSSVTDVGSILQGKSYKRTALIYTATGNISEGKDAAWLGGQLPATPGSNNWAFKTLVGCTPDVLTQNQQAILIGDPVAQVAGKNVNIYQTVGGVNITQMGTMAGGTYIDITVGVDWLQSTIQTNIYAYLIQNAKIPYTDIGTGILISAVKAAIDQGVTNGLIDGQSPITITAPSVATVPAAQRAGRVAPTITFSCRLAGAFNAVIVNGTVTV
jgi:Protein of unknown function (DUF3383)